MRITKKRGGVDRRGIGSLFQLFALPNLNQNLEHTNKQFKRDSFIMEAFNE